jgi:kinesin family member 1
LYGAHIKDEHCTFLNDNGVVTLIPEPGAECYVNGRQIDGSVELTSGSRVILGKNHVFRFNNPSQIARKFMDGPEEGYGESDNVVSDWNYAQIELLEKQGKGNIIHSGSPFLSVLNLYWSLQPQSYAIPIVQVST